MNQLQNYSHPDQPVRHSYPVAITECTFSVALLLCLKTLPFILLRLGILIAFALVALIWFALCGGIAALFAGKNGEHGQGSLILFLVAVAFPGGIYAWLHHYVLYILKLAHVAVITKLVTGDSIPVNKNQIAYGKNLALSRFAEVNTLFVLDSLVTGIVRAFNSSLDWVTGLIPIPGLEKITAVIKAVIHNATTYIDETIFSYNLARGDENVWRSSVDGVVYYGQNAKSVLRTAAWALALEYVLTGIIFILCLIPAAGLGYLLPHAVAGFAWIFAIIIALAIRSAFLNPIFLTMVMLTFHNAVRGQAIELSMYEKMNLVSSKFKDLADKAIQWVSPSSSQTTITSL